MSRPDALALAYLGNLATDLRAGRVECVAFAVENADNGDTTLIIRSRDLDVDAEVPAFVVEPGACVKCKQSNKLVDVGNDEVICTSCNSTQKKHEGR